MNAWIIMLFAALIDAEVYAIDQTVQIHLLNNENAATNELIDKNAQEMTGSTTDNFSSEPPTQVTKSETALTTSTIESTTVNNSSSAPLPAYPTGEPPPTRSAKLGMGLGITLIGIFILAEIIYFQCFYHGNSRRDSYLA